MPDPNVVIIDGQGTRHVFPPGFDPQRAIFIVKAQGQSQAPSQQIDELGNFLAGARSANSAGLDLAMAKSLAEPMTNAVTNFATSPAVPKMAASAGRVMGGIAPVLAGGEAAGLPGAVGGATLAAKGAWAGGKTGWFTGKLAQNLAMLPAKAMNAALPFLQTLSTMSGAQGLLDLAQMAEPNRGDIGFMGIGKSPDAMTLEDALHGMKAANLRHGLAITPQEVEAITNQIAAGAKPLTAINVLDDPKRIAAFKSLVKMGQ